MIEPDLRRRVMTGHYVVDAPEVAAAVLRCATIVVEAARLGDLRVACHRLSIMLIPAQLDAPSAFTGQDEPGFERYPA